MHKEVTIMPVYRARPKTRTLRPPDLYEYSIDNFWFKAAGLANEKPNQPLRGNHAADVVIVGGGYTGLSSAYNIHRRFPDKNIVLLEGAVCGYGASGRNGGFCTAADLLHDYNIKDPQLLQDRIEVSYYGIKQIEQVMADYGVDCDFRENGMMLLAFSENQAKSLEKYHDNVLSLGWESTFLQGKEMESEIKSPRAIALQTMPYGAILNPAKLARGMKRVVEEMGVEIRERSVVTRITPGKMNLVETELGEIRSPELVLAMNAYSHKLGLFKNHLIPACTFIIATESLSKAQWDSIGWSHRQGLSDMRVLFSYGVPTVDDRIVIGGADFAYYPKDRLASGNDRVISKKIEADLLTTFPQLEGVKIEHAWGGTTALIVNRRPSVGRLKGFENVYYGGGYDEGVPTAQTAGRIIADLMAGEDNIFTNHYIVNQKFPYSGPVLLRGFFIDAYQWYLSRWD
jgi:glycine/D-amino acid oxidase-like deaminating enzyme